MSNSDGFIKAVFGHNGVNLIAQSMASEVKELMNGENGKCAVDVDEICAWASPKLPSVKSVVAESKICKPLDFIAYQVLLGKYGITLVDWKTVSAIQEYIDYSFDDVDLTVITNEWVRIGKEGGFSYIDRIFRGIPQYDCFPLFNDGTPYDITPSEWWHRMILARFSEIQTQYIDMMDMEVRDEILVKHWNSVSIKIHTMFIMYFQALGVVQKQLSND